MSQNLTQPEEIDLILRTLASNDLALFGTKPNPAKQKLSLKKTVQSTLPEASAIAGNSSIGARDVKSAHGFSEAYPYVWSM